MLGADDEYDVQLEQKNNQPDIMAERCVKRLLDEILYAGAVDTAN